MNGISDSLIAAILYATGSKAYWKFQNPLKVAIEKTVIHFSKKEGIELEVKSLENLFDSQVATTQLRAFKQGEKFLDGKELALQFAIFSGFYHEDESSIIDISNEIFEYFKTSFTNELLRDPNESIQNLNNIIGIHFDISKAEHESIQDDLEKINQELKLQLSSIGNNVQALLKTPNQVSKRDGIGIYDKTYVQKEFHFSLFVEDPIPIEEIWIEPTYYKMPESNTCEFPFIDSCLEILAKQKILLLVGPYGSGKTIASKKLQLILKSKKRDVIFLSARDLYEIGDSNKIINQIKDRKNPVQDLFIIIDRFDELNLIGREHCKIKDLLFKQCIRLSQTMDGFYFIANTRNIPKVISGSIEDEIDDDVLWLGLAIELEDYGYTDQNICYIRLDYFSGIQVDSWLEKYTWYWEDKSGKELPIRKDYLKKQHKKLPHLCRIPLLLHIVARYTVNRLIEKNLFDLNFETPGDIYFLYDKFVRDTISGKYKLEGKKVPLHIEQFEGHYNSFLSELTTCIAIEKTIYVKDDIEGLLIDDNSKEYSIDEVLVEKIVESSVKKAGVKLEQPNELQKIAGNFFSCYFLERIQGRWSFKDNNVLFCILSNTYFKELKNIIANFDRHTQEKIDMGLRELEPIRIVPQVVEMLFSRIRSLDQDSQFKLEAYLKHQIGTKQLLFADKEVLKIISLDRLNIDILLCLIYGLISSGSREAHLNYFKRMNWYIQSVKYIDKENRYLNVVRRLSRGINIFRAYHKRINFKGYNFSKSKLIDVGFLQCKFDDTIFDYATLKEVSFSLCSLYNMKWKEVRGDIEFKNCKIKELHIINSGPLKIKFHRCSLDSIEFHNVAYDNKEGIQLNFFKSDLGGNIIFKNINHGYLNMEQSFSNVINVKGSKFCASFKDSSYPAKAVDRWKGDGNTNGYIEFEIKGDTNYFRLSQGAGSLVEAKINGSKFNNQCF